MTGALKLSYRVIGQMITHMAVLEKAVLEEKLPIEERQGKKYCNQKSRTSVYLTIREREHRR